jgi:hypothetical protein
LRACLLGFPRDRYLASPLARWLRPSNRKHCSYCCVRVFLAWHRDGRPSIVACTYFAVCLPSACLAMLWVNPSQYYFELEAVRAATEALCLMGCDTVWFGAFLLDCMALHPWR